MTNKAVQHGDNDKVPLGMSCRYTLAIVAMFGTFSLTVMRTNMSVAIVCMTFDPEETNITDNDNCTVAEEFKEDDKFGWSRQLRGWILSSFHLGYLLTQIPGGWLANLIGAKIILGGGMFLLTMMTVLTPVTAQANVYLLILNQAVKGVAAGVYYPAIFQMLGQWTTPSDRTFIVGIVLAGSQLGLIISSILSGFLCEYGFAGGWPSIFYVHGMIGGVWCVVWYFMAFSSPHEHPRISEVELRYIQDNQSNKSTVKTLYVPWNKLLTSVPVYAIFLTDTSFSWVSFVTQSCIPQYMDDVLKFNSKDNGFYNSLPHMACLIIGIGAAFLASKLFLKHIVSVTCLRKCFQSIAMLPGVAIAVGMAFLSENQTGFAVGLLTIWIGFMGFVRGGTNSNIIEIAPRYTGILLGLENILIGIAGISGPSIVGVITTDGTREQWQIAFFLTAAINFFGWLVYVVFASGDEQEWAMEVPHQEAKSQEYHPMVIKFPTTMSKDEADHIEYRPT